MLFISDALLSYNLVAISLWCTSYPAAVLRNEDLSCLTCYILLLSFVAATSMRSIFNLITKTLRMVDESRSLVESLRKKQKNWISVTTPYYRRSTKEGFKERKLPEDQEQCYWMCWCKKMKRVWLITQSWKKRHMSEKLGVNEKEPAFGQKTRTTTKTRQFSASCVWRLWQMMEYEYDTAMETSYQVSFLKSFKRQIDDCYFSFIIVDAVFDKVSKLDEFWSYAMSKGFQASRLLDGLEFFVNW